MTHSTNIVLIDNSSTKRLSQRQIRLVGELVYRLDAVGISYALGMTDNEPAFILFNTEASTPAMDLAQTAQAIGRLERVSC